MSVGLILLDIFKGYSVVSKFNPTLVGSLYDYNTKYSDYLEAFKFATDESERHSIKIITKVWK